MAVDDHVEVHVRALGRLERAVFDHVDPGRDGHDDPLRAVRVRGHRTAEAMRILGVDDHRWLDFEDGGLADVTIDRDRGFTVFRGRRPALKRSA